MESYRTSAGIQCSRRIHIDVRKREGQRGLLAVNACRDLRVVDILVMVNVWSGITGRISARGSDVIGVRSAKDFDQAVVEVRFAIDDALLEIIDLIRLAAEQLRAGVSVIKHS